MKKKKKIKLLKKQIRELSKRYQNLNEKVQILEKQSEAVNNSKLIDINDKLYQDNNIEKEIKDEEKRNSKYYELFKYVYMLIIYCVLSYEITVEHVAQAVFIFLILCLIYIFVDIVYNHKTKKSRYNFGESYWSLLKNLCQTMFPLFIVEVTLLITKSDKAVSFTKDNFSMWFTLSIVILVLLALVVITFLIVFIWYFICWYVDKVTGKK